MLQVIENKKKMGKKVKGEGRWKTIIKQEGVYRGGYARMTSTMPLSGTQYAGDYFPLP